MTLQQSCNGNAVFIVPDGVTKIGVNAFNNCNTLVEIDISEGVTHIGVNAFNNCVNLTSVKLPQTLKVIEDKAFYNCNKLTTIVIPENVSTISNEAFRWTNVTYVTLSPATVYYQDSFDDNTLVNGGIMFNTEELEGMIWSSDDEEEIVEEMGIDILENDETEINEDFANAIGLEALSEEEMGIVFDTIPESAALPPDLHINRTTMARASNLRPKTLNTRNIPRECYDPILWGDENITPEYMSDNNNIVFLKKVSDGYKAQCFSRSSIDKMIKDETGNYLFFQCLQIDNISSANTKQIYVSLPIFAATYMPLEYALHILNGEHQFFLLNYMNKSVRFSINYGVYYQVSDLVSAWHCNPGSNFNVSKPVPVNIE